MVKQYKYLWVNQGRILMGKDPHGTVVVINSQADIDKLAYELAMNNANGQVV